MIIATMFDHGPDGGGVIAFGAPGQGDVALPLSCYSSQRLEINRVKSAAGPPSSDGDTPDAIWQTQINDAIGRDSGVTPIGSEGARDVPQYLKNRLEEATSGDGNISLGRTDNLQSNEQTDAGTPSTLRSSLKVKRILNQATDWSIERTTSASTDGVFSQAVAPSNSSNHGWRSRIQHKEANSDPKGSSHICKATSGSANCEIEAQSVPSFQTTSVPSDSQGSKLFQASLCGIGIPGDSIADKESQSHPVTAIGLGSAWQEAESNASHATPAASPILKATSSKDSTKAAPVQSIEGAKLPHTELFTQVKDGTSNATASEDGLLASGKGNDYPERTSNARLDIEALQAPGQAKRGLTSGVSTVSDAVDHLKRALDSTVTVALSDGNSHAAATHSIGEDPSSLATRDGESSKSRIQGIDSKLSRSRVAPSRVNVQDSPTIALIGPALNTASGSAPNSPGAFAISSDRNTTNIPITLLATTITDDKHPRETDTFATLDERSVPSVATWMHSSTHKVEAGYLDPSLGWIRIRADASSAGVQSSVIPSTPEAADALRGNLTELNSYLSKQSGELVSVTVSQPDGTQHWGGAGSSGHSSDRDAHDTKRDRAGTADSLRDKPVISRQSLQANPISDSVRAIGRNRISVVA